MERESDVPLLEVMMLLQGFIRSCIDKKKFAISKTQLNIFTVLTLEKELTMKQVASYLACSQEQVTRAVAPLADEGYVARRTDPSNRTRVYICLTQEGREYLKTQEECLRSALEEKLGLALSCEERQVLLESSQVLLDLLKKVKLSEKESDEAKTRRKQNP